MIAGYLFNPVRAASKLACKNFRQGSGQSISLQVGRMLTELAETYRACGPVNRGPFQDLVGNISKVRESQLHT